MDIIRVLYTPSVVDVEPPRARQTQVIPRPVPTDQFLWAISPAAWMDSIKVKTPRDFSSASPKRKKHSTIACASCRKLRIRCQGGQPPGQTNRTKPCNHCGNLRRECLWPEEDGRKRPRASFAETTDTKLHGTPTSDEAMSIDEAPAAQSTYNVHRLSIESERGMSVRSWSTVFD